MSGAEVQQTETINASHGNPGIPLVAHGMGTMDGSDLAVTLEFEPDFMIMWSTKNEAVRFWTSDDPSNIKHPTGSNNSGFVTVSSKIVTFHHGGGKRPNSSSSGSIFYIAFKTNRQMTTMT